MYQLDWVMSSDVWLEFNPLGIPIWSYPKKVILEILPPIIPEQRLNLNFTSAQTTFPIAHAPEMQPLVAVNTIPPQTLTVDGSSKTVDVSQYFSPPNNLIYEVSSNPGGIVTPRNSGSRVTITPRAAGQAQVS